MLQPVKTISWSRVLIVLNHKHAFAVQAEVHEYQLAVICVPFPSVVPRQMGKVP